MPLHRLKRKPEKPLATRMSLDFCRQDERVPEVPIGTQEQPQVSCCNSRKTRRFSPQSKMRPFSAAASLEKSQLSS